MKAIGGNQTARLQVKTTQKNAIGERVAVWNNVQELTGFLDMLSGNADYTAYSSKVMESTHVFICDFTPLSPSVNAEDCRMIIGGDQYDITCIDNPMGLDLQLEIFLKFTGGIVNGNRTV